ncbi:MAG: hypothetical protein A3D44_03855 [Candidatus Staskawiczbacteria bacterium RIFCSPHIGHO2_02_FULL_42_22]|uniref:Uncharacterized protein n=1 Tax=Candidatus Staskawiczbacteria bacterium RIFCSPHIGHO2_02_FULL_42_22 TaxID=1802207 RepID=A0A1G2I4C1_9BACT|nr:MAG: hypothetical protein A3D44_03855 [Candidatus Staskawiczbacteria bacterium RIFCSPHIGHO2_02_FULL_42_22]
MEENMENFHDIQDTWKKLKEQEQRIASQQGNLHHELSKIDGNQHAIEKRRLKKSCKELRNQIDHHEECIRRRIVFINRWDRFFGEMWRAFIFSFVYILEWIKGSAENVVNEQCDDLIVAQQVAAYKRKNAKERKEIENLTAVLHAAVEKIAEIDKTQDRARESLEKTLLEVRQAMAIHREAMLQWATEYEENLRWVLEHNPSWRQALENHWRQFRGGNLPGFLLKGIPEPQSSKMAPKKPVRRNVKPENSRVKDDVKLQQQPWTFLVAVNTQENYFLLTQDRAQFTGKLSAMFQKNNYHGLGANTVYKKIIAISNMGVQRRQHIKEVSHNPEFAGWKIVRIGRHRILFSIDETNRQIRLVIRPRKKAYD